MNTNLSRQSIIVNVIGAALVLIALAVGAALGHYSNPGSPAEAVVPTEEPCVTFCGSPVVGGGGNLPNSLTGDSTVGNAGR